MFDASSTPKQPLRIFQFTLARMLVALTLSAVVLSLRVPERTEWPCWVILGGLVVVVLFTDWSIRHVLGGDAMLREGEYARAVHAYTLAIEANPDDPDRYYRRGIARTQLADFEGAIDDYTKAIALDSRCVAAWVGRGLARCQRREFELAVDDLNVALCLATAGRYWLLVRGVCHRELGQFHEALDDLTEEIRRNPRDAGVYVQRGEVYLLQEENESAVRDFEEALRLEPETPYARVGRAIARFRLGQHESALSEIQAALDRSPEDVDALCAQSWFLATCPDETLRNGQRALEAAQAAERLEGEPSYSCEASLAAAYAELGMFDRAIEHGKKSLDLAPAWRRAQFEERLAAYEAGQPYRDHVRIPKPENRQ